MGQPARADTAADPLEKLARRLVPSLVAHRRAVLAVAAVVALIGAGLSGLLYADLRSGVEELLPESAPSVTAMRDIAPRLHSTTKLSVALVGHDGDALERFADDLAARLRALPPGMIEAIDYRSDAKDAFIKRFGLLYLDTSELRDVRDRVKARLHWEHAHALSLLPEEDGPAPSLDFSALESRYAAHDTSHFRKGYFQTADGAELVMMLRPPEQDTRLDGNERLLAAVQREVKALNPSSYDPALRVGYAGEVAEVVEEQHALVADLASSTAVVMVLVLFALWVYFRRASVIAAVLGPLGVGCAVTFGLGDLLIGHLNANTAFLGSVVIGNGINVGIIYVARYLELRRAGREIDDALASAWSGTLRATFVAAFGAGLAYLSLASTDFRGFSQFGLIGGVGMALCWLSAYLLLPPLLKVIEARWPIPTAKPRALLPLGRWAGLVERYPLPLRVATILVLAACGAAVATHDGQIVEYDLTRLRSKQSLVAGAAHWGLVQEHVFQRYLSPVVMRADSPAELQRALAAIEKRRATMGANDPLRDVQSLASAIPADQDEKLKLLGELRGMLTPSRLARLEPDTRAKIEKLLPPGELRAVTLADLPEDARRILVEKDGTSGKIALAFPRQVGVLDMHEAGELKRFLRGAIAESGATVQLVNPLLLLSDMDEAIWRDGPRATLVAFVLVCLLTLLVMGSWRAATQVIAALLLGVSGLVTIAAVAEVRVNFLNFVVLPITFGIGVDYAVNIVQRLRSEPDAPIARVLRETGGAVALCSATTCIGYGSLIIADSQALAGFGLLATAGEVTCLAAALLLLPAWLVRRAPEPAAEPEIAIAP